MGMGDGEWGMGKRESGLGAGAGTADECSTGRVRDAAWRPGIS